jgi:hypothetical protein
MAVRAKFRCAHVKHFAGDLRIVTMSAITDSDTPKDQQFTKHTPGGTLEMSVDNPDVTFEPGKDYYLDFTPVN